MKGPRLKVQGAYRHIDDMRRRTSPLDPELYDISLRKVSGPVIYMNPPTHYQLAYRPKQEIPETLALTIGDAFVNLRGALDHLASGIVRTWGTNVDTKKPIHFPVAPRKDLPAYSSFRAIEQALPGAKELVLKEIRPENGPDERFWSFANLSNDDKHSDLVPTITVVRLDGLEVSTANGSTTLDAIAFDAARPANLVRSDTPITVKGNLKVAVDVQFGQGTLFENEPVIPTLTQIADVVTKALDAFERLIRSSKKL
jgi:hypothetical protein